MRPIRHALASVLILGALSACSTLQAPNPLTTWRPSPNFDHRNPQLIVLHLTAQHGVDESLKTLTDAQAASPVSAHYLIGRDGRRFQLVADLDRAWHAGGGRWGQIRDLNDASLGIELDNDGTAAFTEAQIQSLLILLQDLTSRHRIPKTQVIAHADLAPSRRTDPGPQFPWQQLFEAGFGQWPLATPPAPEGFDGWLAMQAVGYDIRRPAAALRAFRIHFRGRDDGETLTPEFDARDLAILHALVMQAR
ncbi:N-acetylmuramoyl-L-alanine amidase [Lysobacter soyae]|uniref:N-acetylmuramoyl-L-alanine amidase n=1 Tax=Lysobacter soyae TaxID=2764185 RepID=A0ABX8WNP2_9GAMM|nr:N-acetylmuramoyl-L-alanine amidase [Lysobacter sp. CJ11]QYR53054.1 N-acetylmuramoyl-L-alanine amidase [Lysobacter sp. CJ11]